MHINNNPMMSHNNRLAIGVLYHISYE
jgi:hypothetical protein